MGLTSCQWPNGSINLGIVLWDEAARLWQAPTQKVKTHGEIQDSLGATTTGGLSEAATPRAGQRCRHSYMLEDRAEM